MELERQNMELDDRSSSSSEMRSWSNEEAEELEHKPGRRKKRASKELEEERESSASKKKTRGSSLGSGRNRAAIQQSATLAPGIHTDSATTFVHADASSFRELVQKLTGASNGSIKLPITKSAQGRPNLSKTAARFLQQHQHQPMAINPASSSSIFLKSDVVSPKSPLSLGLNPSPSSSASSSSSSQQSRERLFSPLESPRPHHESKLELLALFPMH